MRFLGCDPKAPADLVAALDLPRREKVLAFAVDDNTGSTLAACTTGSPTPQQQHELGCAAGTVTGAVLGGLAGSLIGAGTGQLVATGAGAAIGTAAGARLTCG